LDAIHRISGLESLDYRVRIFVSASNSSDEPIENPYEAYVNSETEEARVEGYSRSESEERRAQMPPIQRSYWIGILVLVVFGCMGLMNYFTTFGSFPFGDILSYGSWISWCTPFALIRLVWHRWNIARAIENGQYPGTQRFGLWYLISSIIFSWLCLFAGGILFFGICLAILATNPNNSYNASAFLLVGDGLLSFLFAGFLFKLGVPRYR
jgi:hypothetical protein